MLNPNIRRALFIETVATVFVLILIQPLLKLLYGGVVWVGTHVYEGLSNQIYQNAALGHRNYVDVMIFSFLASITIGLAMGGIVVLAIGGRRLRRIVRPKIPRKLQRVLHIIGLIVLIVLMLDALLLLVVTWSDLQLNTSFQQRLTVLAPEISEQEYKALQASWAMMRSRTDYTLINERLEDLAHQRGIELPTPLLR